MEYKLCRRVNGSPTRIHTNLGPFDGIQYQAVQVDRRGECLDPENGEKMTINNEDLNSSGMGTVDKRVCDLLIKEGKCPMVAWGLLAIVTEI